MDAKILGDQYANPTPADGVFDSDSAGLTKRELFAAIAMQGLLSGEYREATEAQAAIVARYAVQHADALLAELAKRDK
ncbi:hypothetical protein M8R20_46175 [Pseudomonas sp. R2.Fl]|nr:hypothetical protein [Pseudomonas sp. R2.Fl]MCL6714379.1 hypothetical protein [Pseudomonas sp. R2.Fl]